MSTMVPERREDFTVGIACALTLELDAVLDSMDERYDKQGDVFEKVLGDINLYVTGRIGKHNVVVILLSEMGKVAAARAASNLCTTYTGILLLLLVGICGGLPSPSTGSEIWLGDVVVSKSLVRYDFGRQYQDNNFLRKATADEMLKRPDPEIRNLVKMVSSDDGLKFLKDRTKVHLKSIQTNANLEPNCQGKYDYPGVSEDALYSASFAHKHHGNVDCECQKCTDESRIVCLQALESTCETLGCRSRGEIARQRIDFEIDESEASPHPMIHVGAVACADKVMKSAPDRDELFRETGAIALEMEGEGVWELAPTMVVKGVCDYADCHKGKLWQNYAAAAAAATSKAILERVVRSTQRGEGHIERNQVTTGSAVRPVPSTHQSAGAIFNGPISGTYVVAAPQTTGGTAIFNFPQEKAYNTQNQ